jgi:hypothetical protein
MIVPPLGSIARRLFNSFEGAPSSMETYLERFTQPGFAEQAFQFPISALETGIPKPPLGLSFSSFEGGSPGPQMSALQIPPVGSFWRTDASNLSRIPPDFLEMARRDIGMAQAPLANASLLGLDTPDFSLGMPQVNLSNLS